MKKVLVTGGRGYIGAHVVRALINSGYYPIIFDDGSNTKMPIDQKIAANFMGNIALSGSLETLFNIHGDSIEGVIHLAGKIYVGESVADPIKYYEHNVGGTLNLLKQMSAWGVKKIVFASSAGVYGDCPQGGRREYVGGLYPTSPYGWTKIYGEELLSKLNFKHISLRYFNVAGCDINGRLGDTRYPSSHLMPAIIDSVIMGKPMQINGGDYATPDGTCVRDYVHVSDVADATVLAYRNLDNNFEGMTAFNICSGIGTSNLSVIRTAARIFDFEFDITKAAPRRGDLDILIGNDDRARKLLHFQPKYSNIETMLMTTYQFRRKNSELIYKV